MPLVRPGSAPRRGAGPGPPRGTHTHGHLWSCLRHRSAPPHGERGRIRRACLLHLCGRWLSPWALTWKHGHTAASYRDAMGLCRTPCVAETLSSRSPRVGQHAYRTRPPCGPGSRPASSSPVRDLPIWPDRTCHRVSPELARMRRWHVGRPYARAAPAERGSAQRPSRTRHHSLADYYARVRVRSKRAASLNNRLDGATRREIDSPYHAAP